MIRLNRTQCPDRGAQRSGLGIQRFAGSGLLALAILCGGAAPSFAAPGPPKVANAHYGPDSQQVFDFWAPSSAPAPAVIIFHPGGFVGGDKSPCLRKLIDKLLAHNIAAVCANYRLAPRAQYPAPMLDGGRMVQWMRAHHAEYGIDPNRIAVMGLSAGGAIALWVAYHDDLANPGSSDPVAHESTRVAAVVTSNAQATYDPQTIESAFHTRELPKFLVDLFGAASIDDLRDARLSDKEREASPAVYIHAGGPPTLAYYTADERAPLGANSPAEAYIHNPAQGRYLEQVARERGANIEVHAGQDYAGGWDGFLDAAVTFLDAPFRRQ